MKQVNVHAPASIANLGPGFDVFGIALENLGDTLKLKRTSNHGVTLLLSGNGTELIPADISNNSAGAVLQHAVESYGNGFGFHAELIKGVPVGKGLGSSGASAAAAAYAVNKLLDLNLSQTELVRLAAIGEGAVAGNPHADNVSASLLGGFTIVSSDYEVIRMEPPEMEIVIVIPDVYYENKTRLARHLIPEMVQLRKVVTNISNASKMVAAVALQDPTLFAQSVEDVLIEPSRAEMIPGFWEVKEAAINAGAFGCSISGGGPSLFAIGEDIVGIGKAMSEIFEIKGIQNDVYITKPSSTGAIVI